MSFLIRGRSAWWWNDQNHPNASEPAPEPVAQATGLPVAAPAPTGVTDDLRAADAERWFADAETLYRDGIAVGTLDGAGLATWVADACNTLAEMDEAQAEWEASGEAAHCSMVDIDGEQMRIQGAANWTDQDRREMGQIVSAAKQVMAEQKAAERTEIERQVREEIAAQIEAADSDANGEHERGLIEAARIARGDR
jgi:hypothetical protein